MLTPIKILLLIFLHFLGGLPIIHMVCRVVLLLLLQKLDDDGPSMQSPYGDEGRWQRDRRVPCPALRHPQLSPWT